MAGEMARDPVGQQVKRRRSGEKIEGSTSLIKSETSGRAVPKDWRELRRWVVQKQS